MEEYNIFHMGKNLLFQKPVVSEFGLFHRIFRLIWQKSGLFFETTGFETTGFSPYKESIRRALGQEIRGPRLRPEETQPLRVRVCSRRALCVRDTYLLRHC